MDEQDIAKRFTYHAPKGDKIIRHETVRDRAHDLAGYLNDLVPDSREKSLAFTALEECVMWANAGIARNE